MLHVLRNGMLGWEGFLSGMARLLFLLIFLVIVITSLVLEVDRTLVFMWLPILKPNISASRHRGIHTDSHIGTAAASH